MVNVGFGVGRVFPGVALFTAGLVGVRVVQAMVLYLAGVRIGGGWFGVQAGPQGTAQ